MGRLHVADNSVDYNSLGGPNPTAATQALATRTAEKSRINILVNPLFLQSDENMTQFEVSVDRHF
ncbi:hypothetical protein [Desertibacillus haloalkaliphilus]|uniref:hypothetical protein n=1 Tax=Desertibacillus haloalkaliphilus TaxID=1328930 RepID=UPI001C25B013|nr:hypothetical protein [Desertibacillus haloalkaliphilus]MBU8906294.1 hypothetical protein [Desertibacillus haloalkaliphilus]